MNALQWFKDRIGKKVVVSTKNGHNTVKVLSPEHAESLYKTQYKSTGGSPAPPDYSYRYQEDHEDDYITPAVYIALLSELESNSSGGSQDAVSSSNDSFQGFGGGDFGGGGASVDWSSSSDNSPSSDYSSGSDFSLSDSGGGGGDF